MIKKWRNNKR